MRNLVILGMHRSGTSAVAEQLHRSGLHVGSADQLLVPQEDNPAGFWERRDVVALNDELLAAAGGSWWAPPPGTPTADAAQQQQMQAVLGTLGRQEPWLLKDPRLTLTWPAWAPLVEGVQTLLIIRDPAAVAISLHDRNGFPLTLGLALWEWYNRQALSGLAGDALVVSYDWLVENPRNHSAQLIERLRDAGLQGLAVDGECVLRERPHGAGTSASGLRERAEVLMTATQRELHAVLLARARGESPGLPEAEDVLLWPRLQDLSQALSALGPARETGLQRDRLLGDVKALRGTVDTLENDLVQLKELRERAETERNALTATVSAQAAEREGLIEALTGVYQQLLSHEVSWLGQVQHGQRWLYRALLRRGRPPGAYDNALEAARDYFRRNALALPQRVPGKPLQLLAISRYLLRHPVSSLRGFSLYRLKRALEVLLTASPADFNVWVRSRFPDDAGLGARAMSAQLGPELDSRCLEFPRVTAPRVSIVLPVFNNYRLTIHCLESLLENTPGVDYEVIIADDASSDLTRSIEQRVGNIRVVRQKRNLGFLQNCNAAAARARGDYLLLLNNDTAVGADWLSPLVELLDSHQDIGVVGPRLLFADGRLQEAGGIVWRDGSGWNYGRGDDPQKPEYEYLKDVDYISGACLLVRRPLWLRMRGFDTRYTPAYYEDTDLCFAARRVGFRVCLQPRSVVFHFEGASNGTDQNRGIKRYQKRNQDKFVEKWRATLERDHFDNGRHVFLARDRSRDRNCILVIDHYVPHFDKDAGSRSTLMYIKLMLELGFKVVFLGANFFPHQPYTQLLRDLGVEVLVGEHIARHLDSWLQHNARYIHRVYLHRPHVAEQFLPHLRKMHPRPRIVFFGHDLHYLRVSREESLLGQGARDLSADSWKARELAVVKQVDQVYYPSSLEVEALQRECPGLNVRILPLYVFSDTTIPPYAPRSPQAILFVAGFNHPPNLDGLRWFVDSVLPELVRAHPEVHLHVVGSNATEAVMALQSERISVHGYVPDETLADLYREVACAVVPLRYGAGVKGKVLEAVQHGVPLVTTRIGAEGLQDSEAVMFVADSPEAFAHSVSTVLEGGVEVTGRLRRYGDWLEQRFGRSRVEAILLEDFGPVQRDLSTLDGGQS